MIVAKINFLYTTLIQRISPRAFASATAANIGPFIKANNDESRTTAFIIAAKEAAL